MIGWYLEKSKSNRATCKKCFRKIRKDTTKLVHNQMSIMGYMQKDVYCPDCGAGLLKYYVKSLADMWRLLNNLNQMQPNLLEVMPGRTRYIGKGIKDICPIRLID